MYYIGVDLGTTSVKLLLMSSEGKVVRTVSKKNAISFPHPGWSEQNPTEWYSQMLAGIKELLENLDKEQVRGISFSGQMHGLVVLDETDEVIRPAILWNDGRSGAQCQYLNEEIGREKLSEWTANIAYPGFTAPKLLWMRNNEPELFARIQKIMLPKDYLCYRLSGKFATEVSDASGTLLYDVKNRCWSQEMLAICELRKEQLPTVYESYEVVGNLQSQIAKELGLGHQVKIIAGAGDNAAAAVGTDTVADGSCNISLGTSGTIFICANQFGVDDKNALHSFAHANGKYHLMGCILSAASSCSWWVNQILGTDNFEKEQNQIQKIGENKVFYLPYLMGERSPHNDPDARGTFIGMTMDTTRYDMTQAVMEGVAFALRDSLEIARTLGINIERTKVCGGGGKSRLWVRMLSDIMNMPVDLLENEEGPGLGAAILAAVGCGEYKTVEEATQAIVKVKETLQPEAQIVEKYEIQYQKFRKLYPMMKEIFQMMK